MRTRPLRRSSVSSRRVKNERMQRPRRNVDRTWREPAVAVTASVFRVRHPWACPTTTKQSQWLGIRVWRRATVNVEVRMSHMAARLYNPGRAENEKGASREGGAPFELAKD